MRDLVLYIETDDDPVNFFLAREIILDTKFLNRPEVVAQRIRREYLKQCQMFQKELLPTKLRQ